MDRIMKKNSTDSNKCFSWYYFKVKSKRNSCEIGVRLLKRKMI